MSLVEPISHKKASSFRVISGHMQSIFRLFSSFNIIIQLPFQLKYVKIVNYDHNWESSDLRLQQTTAKIQVSNRKRNLIIMLRVSRTVKCSIQWERFTYWGNGMSKNIGRTYFNLSSIILWIYLKVIWTYWPLLSKNERDSPYWSMSEQIGPYLSFSRFSFMWTYTNLQDLI